VRGGEPGRNLTVGPLRFRSHAISEHAVDGLWVRRLPRSDVFHTCNTPVHAARVELRQVLACIFCQAACLCRGSGGAGVCEYGLCAPCSTPLRRTS
jgi:hypothetical protein